MAHGKDKQNFVQDDYGSSNYYLCVMTERMAYSLISLASEVFLQSSSWIDRAGSAITCPRGVPIRN